MTEAQRQARIAAGCLWEDTEEYLAQQARVKDLMYEFNMSKPSEAEARRALMHNTKLPLTIDNPAAPFPPRLR